MADMLFETPRGMPCWRKWRCTLVGKWQILSGLFDVSNGVYQDIKILGHFLTKVMTISFRGNPG